MTIEFKSNIKATATFSIEKGLLAFLKLKFKEHGEFSNMVYSSIIMNSFNKNLIEEYKNLAEEEKIKIMNKYYKEFKNEKGVKNNEIRKY